MVRIIFIVALFCSFSAFSQKMQFRNFNVKDGLAQSQVYDIASDHKGQLWMATRGGGISIYDGLDFKVLNHKNNLSNDFVFCFAKDNKKQIWVGTNDGLNVFDGTAFHSFYPTDLGPQIWIQDIAVDKKDNLWLATKIGLVKFEKGRFVNISEQLKLQKIVCNAVFIYHDSLLYFGNDFGCFKININSDTYRAEKLSYGTTNPNISVTAFLKTNKDELLAGSYGYGLFKIEQNRLVRFLDTVISRQEIIFDLFEDKQTLYIATLEHGVEAYNFQNKKLTVTDERIGLSSNHVRKIFKDRNGNLWFGTSGGGVSNFGGQLFTHFDRQSGLPDNFIYSVLQTIDRKVWMGAGNKGLACMTSDSIRVYDARNGFMNTKVKSIKELGSDALLIGTEGDGLFIYHDTTFQFVAELGKQFIKDIETAPDGNIWIATAGNGIYRLKPQPDKRFSFDVRQFIDHIINPRIQFLNTQLPGLVFYCTENQGTGLISNERETALRLNTSKGLVSNLTRSMCISKDSIAWIATSDKGIAAFDLKAKKFLPFDNASLSSLNIYILQLDAHGNLIVGTERGLDHVFLDKQRQILKVKHYSKGDGFSGIETCLNAAYANPDGSFWIGTIGGLTLYNPAKGTTNAIAPLLSISGIKLFYNPIENTVFAKRLKSYNSGATIKLPYNQNHLTFDFFGLNISNGEAVNYRWKLENFDEDWSPVSKQHTVTYSNLPPGAYTLLINAANEDGVWNAKPLVYHIIVGKPLWMEWWVIVMAVLLCLLIAYLLIRWRIRSIQKEALDKQHELELVNQLQSLEHKALRLQMNPHFIFNALNSIQSQIGNNNDQEARYYMAKFGKLMRQILHHSEQAWIEIGEELNMIENYLMIEQFCNNKQFDYELKIAPELLQDDYRIPSMIVQPFIENAIKHGFRNLQERKAHLVLEMYITPEGIACNIQDNGKGRPADVLEKDEKQHQSMAINITKKRLQILHNNQSKDFLEIVDLKSEGKPAGTLVQLLLPFQ